MFAEFLPDSLKSKNISIIKITEGDRNLNASLGEAEQQIAEGISHPLRKKQFELGRIALKEALKKCGYRGEADIARGDKGEPLLPEGYAGSLSHTIFRINSEENSDKAVAVAVASSDAINVKLGVDIEATGRNFSDKTYTAVSNEKEQQWLLDSGLSEKDRHCRTLMLISAKEALYKMLYPVCRVYFGMKDAELSWVAEHNYFKARIFKDLGPVKSGTIFTVNSFQDQGLIISLAAYFSQH